MPEQIAVGTHHHDVADTPLRRTQAPPEAEAKPRPHAVVAKGQQRTPTPPPDRRHHRAAPAWRPREAGPSQPRSHRRCRAVSQSLPSHVSIRRGRRAVSRRTPGATAKVDVSAAAAAAAAGHAEEPAHREAATRPPACRTEQPRAHAARARKAQIQHPHTRIRPPPTRICPIPARILLPAIPAALQEGERRGRNEEVGRRWEGGGGAS
jgi:hypothetical protein